jgi:hypothetical protein
LEHFIFEDSPFKIQISFHKLVESLEEIALTAVDYRSSYAKGLLKQVATVSELITGIEDVSLIYENQDLIKNLLADLFPTALTKNEIKAITVPFQNFTFNYTERFSKILTDSGTTLNPNFRNLSNEELYVLSCSMILNSYYKQNFDLNIPLFFDIPDSNGIQKHYRILYNADFIEIIKSEKAINLTQEEIELLIDNYHDINLWKEKFPIGSWILKGFGIIQLFDATTETAVSSLKSNLLKVENEKVSSFNQKIETIFRSIYKIPDLRVGFTAYETSNNKLKAAVYDANGPVSFIVGDSDKEDVENELYDCFYAVLVKDKKTFSISNVANFSASKQQIALRDHLQKQNIQSFILAPIHKDGKLLGILELASVQPFVLNSVNANKLDLVLPFLVDTVDRHNIELENQIEAIVQKEYTAIHPSVYWKFTKEAEKYIQSSDHTKDYVFKEIIFKEVYPLFGEIDIKGSSEHRNSTVKEDLKNQLTHLLTILEDIKFDGNMLLLEQKKYELRSFIEEIEQPLKADTEQQIQSYIENEIHPFLNNSNLTTANKIVIQKYQEHIDEKTGMFYQARKRFDNSLSMVNEKLAEILDKKQVEAQLIFPHYYERFKTDGIEHNLYIGASIEPKVKFDLIYLSNLRLWQLQTLCEMEIEHHKLKKNLSYSLEVTSLILVFSAPITIRFRMDEKRFDVDGSYNARYEVVKKRIDKANIKGSKERITQKEKITIVYSHKKEEAEYLNYIKYLQFKGIIEPTIEKFDIEDLQGVSGLKGIRIKVSNSEL